MNQPPILTAQHISVYYGAVLALDDISFTLSAGERLAIIGPNGAGKSTVLNVLAGLLKPAKGQVLLAKSANQNRIAYIPQRNQVDWQFPVTVADVVMMGRVGKIGLLRRASRADWAIVNEALDWVGLADLAKRQIGALSGGQQQRVFIARALAQEADLFLLDEPLNGLDMPTQESLFTTLDTLRQKQVTVIVSTHNLNLAAARFDCLLLLNQQLIGFGPPAQVFTASLLEQAYGGQLPIINTANVAT